MAEAGSTHGDVTDAHHPHRRVQTLDPLLDRCLQWDQIRLRSMARSEAIVLGACLAICVGIGQFHWTGWILLALLALFFGSATFAVAMLVRSTARDAEWLRQHPSELDWLHVELAPTPKLCHMELHMNGRQLVLFVPRELACAVSEAAAAAPLHVTRTADARIAYRPRYDRDVRFRQVIARLRRPRSSLALRLAPTLLPQLEHRACPSTDTIQATLDQLAILLDAAERYDARYPVITKMVGGVVLEPGAREPPYLKEASRLSAQLAEAVARA